MLGQADEEGPAKEAEREQPGVHKRGAGRGGVLVSQGNRFKAGVKGSR